MAGLRGTPEERRQAKQKQRQSNRVMTVFARINGAASAREELVHACNYALAVGKRLDEDGRKALARHIVAIVDERNSTP